MILNIIIMTSIIIISLIVIILATLLSEKLKVVSLLLKLYIFNSCPLNLQGSYQR